jgi:hypothetical protein
MLLLCDDAPYSNEVGLQEYEAHHGILPRSYGRFSIHDSQVTLQSAGLNMDLTYLPS